MLVRDARRVISVLNIIALVYVLLQVSLSDEKAANDPYRRDTFALLGKPYNNFFAQECIYRAHHQRQFSSLPAAF